MLGCESNFKENVELVVTVALGKIYEWYCLHTPTQSTSCENIFIACFSVLVHIIYFYCVLLKIMYFTKYVEYVHFNSQTYMYRYFYTER